MRVGVGLRSPRRVSTMTGNAFTAQENPVVDAGSSEEELEIEGDAVRDCHDFARQPANRLTTMRDHRVFRGRSRPGAMGVRCGAVHSAKGRKFSRGMSSIRIASFGEPGICSRR